MSIQSIKIKEIFLEESKGIKKGYVADIGSLWCRGHINIYAVKEKDKISGSSSAELNLVGYQV